MSAASTVHDDGPEARRLRLQLFAARRLLSSYKIALEFAGSEMGRVSEQMAAELAAGRKPTTLATQCRVNTMKHAAAKIKFVLD